MSPLPLRMLANRVVLFSVFLPLISFSQVKIKERVEVYPKAQATVAEKSERQARTAAGSDRFFNPPLFVYNSIWNQTRLALPSTLTISGSITIGGDILGNQHTKLLDVGPWGQEHPIAWKGKAGWAGVPYSGESPYTGTFSAGSYPDVRLYLFDYKWTDGVRTMTFGENSLKYDFTGLLYQGHYTPPVPVTATATASGSVLPEARFDRWQLGAPPMFVTGRDSVQVSIAPLDGNGNWYAPWGISPADVEVTLRVDASGSHAYLAFVETRFDWDTEEFVVVQYKSGREITVPLAGGDGSWEQEIQTFLVYNDSKGTFDGLTETVQITITGGGKSKTIPVLLTKEVTCAQVAFNPPELAPGETATLEFKKEDGSAFDASTEFDVGIIGGGSNPGTLSYGNRSGTALTKTKAPVTYRAPSTVEGDSLVVLVAAYAYTSVGGGGGEGGGDVTTVLAKGSTTQKKAPRQMAAQPVALNSDRLILGRIGRLLANNECPAGQAVVKGRALDHFSVTASPDTIARGESAQLTVVALNASGQEVSIDGNTPIAFAVSPTGYGTFHLEGVIPYSQARAGLMRFVSKDQILPSPGFQQVQMTASGAGKSGGGTVTIKNKPCDDAPLCAVPDPPPLPSFTVIPRPNGYNGKFLEACGKNPLALGAFGPILENSVVSIEPFAVDVCFDPLSGKWRFRTTAAIEINCLLDICENNIPSGARRISDLSQLDSFDRCTQGLSDLQGHRSYGVKYSKYVFTQVLLMHEQMHMWDFKAVMLTSLPDLAKPFAGIQDISCGRFGNTEAALHEGSRLFRNLVNSYLRSAVNNWNANRMSEQRIHNSVAVRGLIDELVKQLNCTN